MAVKESITYTFLFQNICFVWNFNIWSYPRLQTKTHEILLLVGCQIGPLIRRGKQKYTAVCVLSLSNTAQHKNLPEGLWKVFCILSCWMKLESIFLLFSCVKSESCCRRYCNFVWLHRWYHKIILWKKSKLLWMICEWCWTVKHV